METKPQPHGVHVHVSPRGRSSTGERREGYRHAEHTAVRDVDAAPVVKTVRDH